MMIIINNEIAIRGHVSVFRAAVVMCLTSEFLETAGCSSGNFYRLASAVPNCVLLHLERIAQLVVGVSAALDFGPCCCFPGSL